MSATLQILPKCPDCGRLSVDNPQHCPEKNAASWAASCQWKKCVGTTTGPDGKATKCRKVYGVPGWPGFKAQS